MLLHGKWCRKEELLRSEPCGLDLSQYSSCSLHVGGIFFYLFIFCLLVCVSAFCPPHYTFGLLSLLLYLCCKFQKKKTCFFYKRHGRQHLPTHNYVVPVGEVCRVCGLSSFFLLNSLVTCLEMLCVCVCAIRIFHGGGGIPALYFSLCSCSFFHKQQSLCTALSNCCLSSQHSLKPLPESKKEKKKRDAKHNKTLLTPLSCLSGQ